MGTRASRNQFIVREKAAFTASGVADPEGQAHDPTQPSRGVVSTSNMGKKMALSGSLLQFWSNSKAWAIETLEGKHGSTAENPAAS